MRLSTTLVLFVVAQSEATRLFVASYSGNVTTLALTNQTDNTETETYALEIAASSTACAGSPSWLTLDKTRDLLYCLDRGLTAENGTLNSLAVKDDGSLVSLGRIATPIGGVASVLYGDGGLAVAYYTSSSVGTYNITNPSDLQTLQTITYSTVGNHTTPPHPHHAILDPTGHFVIVPDLGSDLIRIYSINELSGLIEEIEEVETPFGAGPRHGEFLVTDEGKTFLFVTCELGNLLIAYQVLYDGVCGLQLVVVQETSLLVGTEGRMLQTYSAAAEVHVSPDKNFLLVSQRNDSSFSIPNPLTTITSAATNTTGDDTIISDSLLTFSINQTDGSLSLFDQSPAGGQFPRQFSVNKRGDLVAVGLQTQGTVVVYERDLESGVFGGVVASFEVGGSVVCVVWDE